jgi:hypothetical protein
MSGIAISKLVRQGLNLGFGLGSELVKPLSLGKGNLANDDSVFPPGALLVPVNGLVTNFNTSAIPGSAVVVGDERVMVRAAELAGVLSPGAGDYLEDPGGILRRKVIAALKDPTDSFWIFQTRRLLSSERGNGVLVLQGTANLLAHQAEVRTNATLTLNANALMLVDIFLLGQGQVKLIVSAADLAGLTHLTSGAGITFGASASLYFASESYLEVTGPESLALWEDGYYTATLHHPDGSTETPEWPTWTQTEHLGLLGSANPGHFMGVEAGSGWVLAAITVDGHSYNDYCYITVT